MSYTRFLGILTSVNILRITGVWAGHLMRMEEEEIPKRITTLQLGGQRGRGRPRLRWMDGVNGDAVSLGMRNWKTIALDRARWKSVLEEAQTHEWVVAP